MPGRKKGRGAAADDDDDVGRGGRRGKHADLAALGGDSDDDVPQSRKPAPKAKKKRGKMTDEEYRAMMAEEEEEASKPDPPPQPKQQREKPAPVAEKPSRPKSCSEYVARMEQEYAACMSGEVKPRPRPRAAAGGSDEAQPSKKAKAAAAKAEEERRRREEEEEEDDDDSEEERAAEQKRKEEEKARKKKEAEEKKKREAEKAEAERKRKQKEEEERLAAERAAEEEEEEEEEEEKPPTPPPKKGKKKGKQAPVQEEEDEIIRDAGEEEAKVVDRFADVDLSKLSRKERIKIEKERKKQQEYDEIAKQAKGGYTKAGDSPYDIKLAADAWKVDKRSPDIKIQGISVNVPGKELFRNTTIKVMHGHRYGLAGPNGKGKSTVLKLISERLVPVPELLDVLLVEQEQEVDEDFLEMTVVNCVIRSHKKMHRLERRLEQLYDIAEPSDEEAEEIQEIEDELQFMGAGQKEGKARKILKGLQFPEAWQDRKTKSFSGGWRKRVALACAVYMEPDVLLLDEPTNHLDLNAVLWLGTYLPAKYNQRSKRPRSLVVVSHDVSFLEEVCTDTVHIEGLKLNYYRGGYDVFEQCVAQSHEQHDKKFKQQESQIKAWKRQGLSKKQVEEKLQELAKRKAQAGGGKRGGGDDEDIDDRDAKLERRRDYTVTFPFENPAKLRSSCILKLEAAHFRYPSDEGKAANPWLFGGPENPEGVNFSVWTDSRIALVGPNGCGKTTLLLMLCEKLGLSEGICEISRSVRIGRYSQHFVGQLPLERSPIDYLSSIEGAGMTMHTSRAKLGSFGLESEAHKQLISTLSGGQKVRVAFAGISCMKPHVLLLDEPTNHLDMESITALGSALKGYEGGVLVITHDARLLRTIDAQLHVVENKSVTHFKAGLDAYKEHLLAMLEIEEERKEAEAERVKLQKRLAKGQDESSDEEDDDDDGDDDDGPPPAAAARPPSKKKKGKEKEMAEEELAAAKKKGEALDDGLEDLFRKEKKKKEKKEGDEGKEKKEKKKKDKDGDEVKEKKKKEKKEGDEEGKKEKKKEKKEGDEGKKEKKKDKKEGDEGKKEKKKDKKA